MNVLWTTLNDATRSGYISITFSTSCLFTFTKIRSICIILSSPGSTVGKSTVEESLALIADCINRAHEETFNVVIVLENMVWFLSYV